MVSEEQLELSENGSDKEGLFKVFWRGWIKQYSCEMGFEKYNLLDLVGAGLQGRAGFGGGHALAGGSGCEPNSLWLDRLQ